MEFLSKSLEETAKIARNLSSKLKPRKKATVIGLYGELGSGKTTFMKYLAESFRIEEIIQSPTFVIEKVYELRDTSNEIRKNSGPSNIVPRTSYFDHLIHIDAYRIEKEEEMLNLGWQEIMADPKNLICVEWPERIAGIMPEHVRISFEHIDKSSRKIKIEL